jgi:hypothetical protein
MPGLGCQIWSARLEWPGLKCQDFSSLAPGWMVRRRVWVDWFIRLETKMLVTSEATARFHKRVLKRLYVLVGLLAACPPRHSLYVGVKPMNALPRLNAAKAPTTTLGERALAICSAHTFLRPVAVHGFIPTCLSLEFQVGVVQSPEAVLWAVTA